MNKKIEKLLLLVSSTSMTGILIILFYSAFNHEGLKNIPWASECKHMIPNRILWVTIVLLILAIVPVSYYFISKISETKLKQEMELLSKTIDEDNTIKTSSKDTNYINTILRFSNPDERIVLKKLIENKGDVLQSEITRENYMDKLKTHRAVNSLKIKGIIRTEKYGKTNRIVLEDQIKDILLEKES